MSYLTDGVHLYELLDRLRNYGRLGGEYLLVRDCETERVRAMSPLESSLCLPVTPTS
jgi:hypothetical protein